jgi:excisionase family DNA binding protein
MTGSERGRKANQPRLEELISLEQAARLSGLTADHLRRLVRQGDLWGKKIGRNWVTAEQAVREYLARDRRPGPKPSKRT